MERTNAETNLLVQRLIEKEDRSIDPMTILSDALHVIEQREHRAGRYCWDLLVEVLADHLRLTRSRNTSLKEEFESNRLLERYCRVARMKPWDHLGELFILERMGNPRLGQNLTPKPIADLMVMMNMMEEPTSLQTMLDPCVGTGRFLLSTSNLYPYAPIVLYGVEIDLSLYRACLVNMRLMSTLPYNIICADSLRTDPLLSSPIWRYVNLWDPPDLNIFYWKEGPPPKHFSLRDWVKEMRWEQQ